MAYKDAGHRPHAVHTGETPQTKIARGPEALTVTLDTWGPKPPHLFNVLWNALQSNWGENPERALHDRELSKEQLDYVERCFNGGTLQQVLEGIVFHFTIDGVCRPATHQIVRTRLGAGFMQHGGRDNDWRHRGWSMPETIARACNVIDGMAIGERVLPAGIYEDLTPGIANETRADCLTSKEPILTYLRCYDSYSQGAIGLREAIEDYLSRGKDLYAALVDAGIPWQDARRFLTMGSQTYIHAVYNYVSLRDVLANRLEFIMDWEINCVMQLMLREIRMHCPQMLYGPLKSRSDTAQKALFAGLESWPPDGKWPVSPEDAALPRTHRPEQNPFWVLAPESYDGKPIRWIATDGVFPASLR